VPPTMWTEVPPEGSPKGPLPVPFSIPSRLKYYVNASDLSPPRSPGRRL